LLQRPANFAATPPPDDGDMLTSHHTPTVFDDEFSGLPDLAHGGYMAGVMATALGAAEAEVRLRRPVRTGRALDLVHTADEAVELRDGDTLLARAAHTDLALDVPAPVTPADAQMAADHFLGRHRHVFPGCFVCGTGRAEGDGLRIFPGPVEGRGVVAAPWLPPGDGVVPDRLVWAAFDCAQLWALITHAPADTTDRVVTASLATRIDRPVVAGDPHVVVGWPIGRDDRGWVAGAALFTAGGELLAAGRQRAAVTTWGIPLSRADWHR
jgi:hypothetical protein